MDPHKLEELTCFFCRSLFDDNYHCPSELFCSHTLCHSCLNKFIKLNGCCPICNCKILFLTAESVPVNLLVRGLVAKAANETSKCATWLKRKRVPSSDHNAEESTPKRRKPLPSEGHCEEHDNSKQTMCMDSSEFICGICAALDHKQCRTLLVESALKEMKTNVYQMVESAIDVQNAHCLHVHRLRKYLVHIIEFNDYVPNLEKIQENIKQLETLQCIRRKFCGSLRKYETCLAKAEHYGTFLITSGRIEDLLGNSIKLDLHLTLPRQWHYNLDNVQMKQWLKEEKLVHVLHPEDMAMFGKAIFKGDSVWVYSYDTLKSSNFSISSYPVILSFWELFDSIKRSSSMPMLAFLQLGNREKVIGDIVVAMSGLDYLSFISLILCSGLKGTSFNTHKFFYWDLVATDYMKENYDDALANEIGTFYHNSVMGEAEHSDNYLARPSASGNNVTLPRHTASGNHVNLSRPTASGNHVCLLRPTASGNHVCLLRPTAFGNPMVNLSRPTAAWRLFCKYGIVKEGMETCKEIVSKAIKGHFEEVCIYNCGVII